MGGVLNNALSMDQQDNYTLSEKNFHFICELVYESTGIVLGESKREMISRRLMRRVRELKVASFSEYCEVLQAEIKTGSKDELLNFTNNITTNLTSFFRENHHFDFLKTQFFPEHIQQHGKDKKLRIWSAACSTGEEPYSLAITLMETMAPIISSWDVKILATDLDTNVLAQAKSAVYTLDRIKDIAENYKQKWFKEGTGDNFGHCKVHPELARLISFKPLNLLHDWPIKGPFDVVMCRNVLIYFDKKTQQQLISRYNEILRPGGLLILGHSESLGDNKCNFILEGHTIFRKPLLEVTKAGF